MKPDIRVKRIYDEPSQEDGFRILVDRLWPRGVFKEAAAIDLWPKELTPSNDLRKWFHADPTRYTEFTSRYIAELDDRIVDVKRILASVNNPTVTLLSSTKDLAGGHVGVLKQFIEAHLSDASGYDVQGE